MNQHPRHQDHSVHFLFSLLTAFITSISLPACTPHRATGSYAGGTEATRDPAAAERFHQQAIAIIDTDPSKAESLLRQALALDLYHGPAHNNLGALLLQQRKLYDAAGEFQWACKLLPGHPDPRTNLAHTLELAGRADEALTTYRAALDLYPNHLPTLQALTRLQIIRGTPDADTPRMLAEVALRGETPEWRTWAQLHLTKSPSAN